jgi:hypothetical protein
MRDDGKAPHASDNVGAFVFNVRRQRISIEQFNKFLTLIVSD